MAESSIVVSLFLNIYGDCGFLVEFDNFTDFRMSSKSIPVSMEISFLGLNT